MSVQFQNVRGRKISRCHSTQGFISTYRHTPGLETLKTAALNPTFVIVSSPLFYGVRRISKMQTLAQFMVTLFPNFVKAIISITMPLIQCETPFSEIFQLFPPRYEHFPPFPALGLSKIEFCDVLDPPSVQTLHSLPPRFKALQTSLSGIEFPKHRQRMLPSNESGEHPRKSHKKQHRFQSNPAKSHRCIPSITLTSHSFARSVTHYYPSSILTTTSGLPIMTGFSVPDKSSL